MQVKSLVTVLCLIKIHWWDPGCDTTLMTNHSGGKTIDTVQVNCFVCASQNTVFRCGGTPCFLKRGPPPTWEAAHRCLSSIQNHGGCVSSHWQCNNTPVTAPVITCRRKSYAEGILCIVNIFKCDLAAGNKEEKLEPQDHQICIACV